MQLGQEEGPVEPAHNTHKHTGPTARAKSYNTHSIPQWPPFSAHPRPWSPCQTLEHGPEGVPPSSYERIAQSSDTEVTHIDFYMSVQLNVQLSVSSPVVHVPRSHTQTHTHTHTHTHACPPMHTRVSLRPRVTPLPVCITHICTHPRSCGSGSGQCYP